MISHAEFCKKKDNCWPEHRDCTHREYIGKEVKLNGERAIIHKDEEGWPWVAQVRFMLKVPYSWTAIYNIVENHGGEFKA